MQLTDLQKDILENDTRFKILIAGRRFSKTFIALNYLAQQARFPNKKVMYISPSYRMSKQIAWEDLKNMLRDRGWAKKINESDLTIKLINSSIIMLRSADNPDSIRGIGLDAVVIDEAADVPKLEETWRAVIRPTLSDRGGKAFIIGTPKGRGFLYDLYNDAKHLDDWISWQYTTAAGGQVSNEELEQAKRDLDERTYKQEYEATFIEMVGQIYYAFGEHNIQQNPLPADERLPIHVGIDFNYSPGSAVFAFQHSGGLHIFDELEIYGTDTQEMAQEIKRRVGKRKIFAYPDASGSQRRTSAIGGITDHIILKNAGFELKVGSINPAVKDRIASVNSVLKVDNTRLTIDPKCVKLINALRKHCYAEGTRQPEKNSGLDHLNDALGYMVNNLYPVRVEYQTSYNTVRRNTGRMGR